MSEHYIISNMQLIQCSVFVLLHQCYCPFAEHMLSGEGVNWQGHGELSLTLDKAVAALLTIMKSTMIAGKKSC